MIQRRAKAVGMKARIGKRYLLRHAHHRLPDEQRHAPNGAAHFRPRTAAHDEAL